MAYQTGTVSSFAGLKSAILSFLSLNGWTLEGSNLVKKGNIVAEITTGFDGSPSTESIRLRGAKSSDGGGNLADVQEGPTGFEWLFNEGRMSESLQPGGLENITIAWPITYSFHLASSPVDEFWCFIEFNGGHCQHMGFGNIVKASSFEGGAFYHGFVNGKGFESGLTKGLAGWRHLKLNSYTLNFSPLGASNSIIPFAPADISASNYEGYTGWCIHAEVAGVEWYSGVYTKFYSEQRNFINHEMQYEERATADPSSPYQQQLIPFRIFAKVPNLNRQRLGSIKNLKFTRNARLSFGEIISDGTDRWKVYPVYFKDTDQPDPPANANHSGTYALAVLYDGP